MDKSVLTGFVTALNLVGIFVFAISGAVSGIKRKTDIVGVLMLSFAAAACGGIVRDILIGDVPPENISTWEPLVVSLTAGLLTFFFFPVVDRLNNPVLVFDAFGLGLFTVTGTSKALAFGIMPVWAVLLGMVTGVGGGMLRDMLVARVPIIMRGEIYATAALAGGAIVVLGTYIPGLPPEAHMLAGAAVCTGIRLLALRFGWQLPARNIRR